jgi:hypothetical protein
MKISAMVLVSNNEPFLEYCVNSLVGVVDSIYFVGPPKPLATEEFGVYWESLKGKFTSMYSIPQRPIDETNFAAWRNQCLEEMKKNGTDWVLFVDADEVFANSDGTPVTRTQLEEMINNEYTTKELDDKTHKEKEVKFNAESFDFFTRHFVWNYFTLDARQNGMHYSEQRLFKLPKEPISCEYVREVHEVLVWYRNLKKQKMAYFPKRVRVTPKRRLERFHPAVTLIEYENDHVPIIWHFADLKGMEDLRKKYEIRGKIKSNPFNVERKDMNNDQFCAQHPKFNGKLPVNHYTGRLPSVLRLW